MPPDRKSNESANGHFQRKRAPESALWSEIEAATAHTRAKIERLRALRMAHEAAVIEGAKQQPDPPGAGEVRPARPSKSRKPKEATHAKR